MGQNRKQTRVELAKGHLWINSVKNKSFEIQKKASLNIIYSERIFRLAQKVLKPEISKTISFEGTPVKTAAWIPQVDILADPKTKIFISHCGNHGAHEDNFYL